MRMNLSVMLHFLLVMSLWSTMPHRMLSSELVSCCFYLQLIIIWWNFLFAIGPYLCCFLLLRMGSSVIIGVSDKVQLNFLEISCLRLIPHLCFTELRYYAASSANTSTFRLLELLGRQSLRVEVMMKVLVQRLRGVQLLKYSEGRNAMKFLLPFIWSVLMSVWLSGRYMLYTKITNSPFQKQWILPACLSVFFNMPLFSIPWSTLFYFFLCMSGCTTCLEDNCSKYSKNSKRNNASTYGHTNFISCVIFLRKASGLIYFMFCFTSVEMHCVFNIAVCCLFAGCWEITWWACKEAWWEGFALYYSNPVTGTQRSKCWQKTSKLS